MPRPRLPARITTEADVRQFFKYLFEVDGTAIHPDDRFWDEEDNRSGYVDAPYGQPTYTRAQARVRDRLMDEAWEVVLDRGKDIYQIAMEVGREVGGYPGDEPPARPGRKQWDPRLKGPRMKGTQNSNRGAGILFQRTDDGRIFLALRSQEVLDPGVWGVPGGQVEEGERTIDAAFAETAEEIGSIPGQMEIVGDHVYRAKDGFTFTTYHVTITGNYADAWVPVLNWESDEWGWFSINDLPKNIHPGVVAVLDALRP